VPPVCLSRTLVFREYLVGGAGFDTLALCWPSVQMTFSRIEG
jgi:hypothetical protein